MHKTVKNDMTLTRQQLKEVSILVALLVAGLVVVSAVMEQPQSVDEPVNSLRPVQSNLSPEPVVAESIAPVKAETVVMDASIAQGATSTVPYDFIATVISASKEDLYVHVELPKDYSGLDIQKSLGGYFEKDPLPRYSKDLHVAINNETGSGVGDISKLTQGAIVRIIPVEYIFWKAPVVALAVHPDPKIMIQEVGASLRQ